MSVKMVASVNVRRYLNFYVVSSLSHSPSCVFLDHKCLRYCSFYVHNIVKLLTV